MTDNCAKWHPELPIRCEAPRAHKDDHYSELNGTRHTWPNDRAPFSVHRCDLERGQGQAA